MLAFIFLILTIAEIFLTIQIVKFLKNAQKRVETCHEKFILVSTEILMINDKIKDTIKKTNKVLKFVTNKRFFQTVAVLKTVFNTVQIILLIRSLDFSKNKGLLNYKNVKKLLLSEIIRRFIRKVILNTANLV